jgi:membrane protease YdiL (CAAX protease family)
MTMGSPAKSRQSAERHLDHGVEASLRGWGPLGILATVIIVLFGSWGGILVLIWARLSSTPWHDIGFVRPKSWPVTLITGALFGIAFKLLMKMIVLPLFGADPINQAYHFLTHNRAALPGMLLTVLVAAGFGEETVFRGFLFERLGKLLGKSGAAKTAIVLFTSALFAIAHYRSLGTSGVEQAAMTGLVFGTIYSFTGRIWFPMIAHAAFDVTAVAIIYWNLESYVAHLVFK